MNMNQIVYDLTYWFDFVLLAVSHHPLISVATVLVAFLFYQALGVMKVIGTIISFALAVATAILLQMLMWDADHRPHSTQHQHYPPVKFRLSITANNAKMIPRTWTNMSLRARSLGLSISNSSFIRCHWLVAVKPILFLTRRNGGIAIQDQTSFWWITESDGFWGGALNA